MRNLYFVIAFIYIFSSISAQQFVPSQDFAGIDHLYYQVQFNGGGLAWVDIDNDNDDDLYVVGGERGDALYVNHGDGTFTNISASAGIDITDDYYTTGVIYGDVDNDGDKDIFVNTNFSNTQEFARNLLFINNGDYTFTESWPNNNEADRSMTMGSVMLDYDLDGDLDIYTVSYVQVIRFTFDDDNKIDGYAHDCFANQLYRNDGNLNFTNVTISTSVNDTGCALAVTASDFDMDNDIDLLVGNDFGPFIEPNIFYQNDLANNKFTKTPDSYGTNVAMYAMGFGVSDYDNDLDLDYYISNIGSNVFLENQNGQFVNVAAEARCENQYVFDNEKWSVSWGNFFADIDNDGDEDLFVANGYVPGPTSILDNDVMDPDRLFINNGDKTFTMIDTLAGINNTFPSRGTAYSDYDMDGDIDFFTAVFNKPNFGASPQSLLMENVTETSNNWVQFRLKGTQVNKDAYGSKVYLHSDGKVQMRELGGGASFSSHSSSVIHFGIAESTSIDSVEVIWTGGMNRQTLYDVAINEQHTIIEDMINSNQELEYQELSIYPNPAHNLIRVKYINLIDKVKILETTGRIVYGSGALDKKETTIDISDLSAGIYILEVVSGGKTDRKQVFIVR